MCGVRRGDYDATCKNKPGGAGEADRRKRGIGKSVSELAGYYQHGEYLNDQRR